MTYSEKLRDPRWQRKRLEILESTDFTCQLCKAKDKELHVHHLSYHGNPWEAPNTQLVALCAHCHEFVPRIVGAIAKDLIISLSAYDLHELEYGLGVEVAFLEANNSKAEVVRLLASVRDTVRDNKRDAALMDKQ